MRGMDRIIALESLRGVAAYIVVLTHFVHAFFPFAAIGSGAVLVHSKFEPLLLNTPLNIFINGHFAVICFFVLSGFVLSYGFFRKNIDLVDAVIKRYFRLAPIVFCSILLAYFLLKFGLFQNIEVAQLAQSDWLSRFWKYDVNFLDALWAGIAGSFVIAPNAASLNPVLWTIYYELIGSLLIFSFMALLGNDRRRWLVYPLVVAVLINTYFVGFIVGMILCDLYIRREDIFESISGLKKGYKVALLVIAIYFASFPAYLGDLSDVGLIHQPLIIFDNYNLTKNILYILAATITVVMLLTSNRVKKFFENKLLIAAGGISYSLYATHFLILGTVATTVFLYARDFVPYNYAALIALGSYVVAATLVAILFRKYVDLPSISLSRKVSRVIKGSHSRAKESSAENIL